MPSALDRAFTLQPDDPQSAAQRAALLDELALDELGLTWRYVPAGSFLQGSTDGDPDERPVHRMQTEAYWLTDAPLSWTACARLLGWPPPPAAPDARAGGVRWWYCGGQRHEAPLGALEPVEPVPEEPSWDERPMVSVNYALAELAAEVANRNAPAGVRYALPSESAWEKAARGGLSGQRYAWGNQPAAAARCDCEHFGAFALRPTRSLPPNGYGLYGMCGGVWEWTADRYDALAYHLAAGGVCPAEAPAVPSEETQAHVLRGGSWADAGAACTVSFRMARRSDHRDHNPNTGVRLLRWEQRRGDAAGRRRTSA